MITFEHVSKRYPGTERAALNDISVEVDEGEFVFLVGSSGSGKSTFLRLLLKEDEPSEGRIRVGSHELRNLSSRRVPLLRRSVGCVFQDFRLLPNKSVTQNVAFALEVIGAPRSEIRGRVERVLALVGLEDKAARLPSELSGGEQQRVAIARAVVNEPPLLIADEPTGNLDPSTAIEIMRLLDRINRTGTTIVMATHDAVIVDSLRRRVVELRGGELLRDQSRGVYGAAR